MQQAESAALRQFSGSGGGGPVQNPPPVQHALGELRSPIDVEQPASDQTVEDSVWGDSAVLQRASLPSPAAPVLRGQRGDAAGVSSTL